MRRMGALALVVAVLAAGAGCIGTTSREDFNEVVQARGGGLTSDLPLAAVAAVAAELGSDDFSVRSLTVTPLDATVLLDVRDPAVPENLDQYTVRRGHLESVEPIRLTEADDLDAQTFPVSGLPLDRVEGMVDAALAEFGAEGYASSLDVSRPEGDEVVIVLALESPRATGTATFTGGGHLIEVSRS